MSGSPKRTIFSSPPSQPLTTQDFFSPEVLRGELQDSFSLSLDHRFLATVNPYTFQAKLRTLLALNLRVVANHLEA
jgi:hypothetical protein